MSASMLPLPHLGPQGRALLDRIVASGRQGVFRSEAIEWVLERLIQLGYVEQHPLDTATLVHTQAGLHRWQFEVLAEEQRAAAQLRRQLIRQRVEARNPGYALVPAGPPASYPAVSRGGATYPATSRGSATYPAVSGGSATYPAASAGSAGTAIVALPALAGPSAPAETGPNARRNKAYTLAAVLAAATALAMLLLASLDPTSAPWSSGSPSQPATGKAAPSAHPEAVRAAAAEPPSRPHGPADTAALHTVTWTRPNKTIPAGTPKAAPPAPPQYAMARNSGTSAEPLPGNSSRGRPGKDADRSVVASPPAAGIIPARTPSPAIFPGVPAQMPSPKIFSRVPPAHAVPAVSSVSIATAQAGPRPPARPSGRAELEKHAGRPAATAPAASAAAAQAPSTAISSSMPAARAVAPVSSVRVAEAQPLPAEPNPAARPSGRAELEKHAGRPAAAAPAASAAPAQAPSAAISSSMPAARAVAPVSSVRVAEAQPLPAEPNPAARPPVWPQPNAPAPTPQIPPPPAMDTAGSPAAAEGADHTSPPPPATRKPDMHKADLAANKPQAHTAQHHAADPAEPLAATGVAVQPADLHTIPVSPRAHSSGPAHGIATTQGPLTAKPAVTQPARRVASDIGPAAHHRRLSHPPSTARAKPHRHLSGNAEVELLNEQSLAAARNGHEWRPLRHAKG